MYYLYDFFKGVNLYLNICDDIVIFDIWLNIWNGMVWINIFYKGMNLYLVFCDVFYYLSKIVFILVIYVIYEGSYIVEKVYILC